MITRKFRVALTSRDFEQAVSFYRDGLGLESRDLWIDNGRGQLLGAGEATLFQTQNVDSEQAKEGNE